MVAYILIYKYPLYLHILLKKSIKNIIISWEGTNMRQKKANPLRQLPAESRNYGEIKIHLKEILEERDISLNQLSFRAEMQRTQLRNYRDNKIQRLDIDILNRLCYVLECDLHELIEYIPPEKTSRK